MADTSGRLTRQEAVTLKEYVDTRIAAVDKAQELFQAANRDRLASMNEIREQLRAQATTFVTRAELDANCQRINAEIEPLERSMALLEGKASQQSVNIASILAVLGLLIGVAGLVLSFIH